MSNEMILVVGMAIIFFYILFSSTVGEKSKTYMLKLEQMELGVVDFIPKGEVFPLLKLRGMSRIKLPTKEEQLNLEEFISMAHKQNQDTVYRNLELAPWGYNEYYHIFNQDKTIGWVHNGGWQPR